MHHQKAIFVLPSKPFIISPHANHRTPPMTLQKPRVAIVHDWLVTYAGAERVLEQMIQCYPEADLFSLVDFLPDNKRGFIANKPVHTSFIQKLPKARTKYRSYLPLMALAIEQFDLSSYDLILSSSHAVAKGVLTGPDQLHISYVHSPIRYAWDLQHQYLKESRLDHGIKGWIARIILHYVRLWDTRTANGVDSFIANSAFVARRIFKVYRRQAQIIAPPVDISSFTLQQEKQNYYVTASRMVPYKKVDLIVAAFTAMPDKKLIVIGDGPDYEKVRAAAGPNVQLLGFAESQVLLEHLQNAKAFVFAAEEDFGIAPLEAQACGTPVIAFGKGGARETIVPLLEGNAQHNGPEMQKATGVFFYEQTQSAIMAAVEYFEKNIALIKPINCRENALRFGSERFCEEFKEVTEKEWISFNDKN